ncbi:MAG: hypothetical protein Crog4KO_08050 [Crocinitomicaceae bacterium]
MIANAQVKNGKMHVPPGVIETGKEISMKGEWAFYWKQLPFDASGKFDAERLTTPEYFMLPGDWGQLDKPAFGFGTLHAQFTGLEDREAIAFFADIRSSYEVWCNGKKVIGHSDVFEPKKEPLNPRPLRFELPPADTVDVYIVLSNYYYRNHGRVGSSLLLSSKGKAAERARYAIAKSGFILTFLLTMGVFSVLLYFLGFKRRIFLYFGLTFIGGALREAALHENILLIFWDSMPGHLLNFLKFGSAYLSIGFGTLYFKELFPKDSFTKLSNIFAGLCFSASTITLIFPMQWNTFILAPMTGVMAVTIFYGVVTVVRAFLNKRQHALLSLIGISLFFTGLINDILTSYEIIATPYLIAYFSVIIAVLNVSIIISLFRQSERDAFVLKRNIKNKSQDIESLAVDRVSSLEQQRKTILLLEQELSNPGATTESLKEILRDWKFKARIEERAAFEADHIEHINAEFVNRLYSKYPQLTDLEVEICTLIRVKLSNKEIAAYRGTTEDAVRVSKSRIRKKMNLQKGQRLEAILMNLPD